MSLERWITYSTRITQNSELTTAEWNGSGGSSLTCKLWGPGSIEGQSTLITRWITCLWGRNVSEHFGFRLHSILPHSSTLTATAVRAACSGRRNPAGAIDFSLPITTISALRPTQTHIQWVSLFFPRGKAPGLELNHTPAPSAEVKNVWSYTSSSFICLPGVGSNNFTVHITSTLHNLSNSQRRKPLKDAGD